MPHDKNGSHLEEGDFILTKPYDHPVQVIGRIATLNDAQRCSGQITWPGIGGMVEDRFHAEEATLYLKSNGITPTLLAVTLAFIDETRNFYKASRAFDVTGLKEEGRR